MNGFTLLLIASTFGVDYGWQPSADGQLEYIVQIEPVTLIALQQGQEIVSQIDPYVQTVRRFRIRQGTDLVARRGEPPRQPPPTLPADTIESQVPGVTFGWQPMEDQRFELTVQIAPNRLAALRNGEEIAAEIPAEVTTLGRLKILSGAKQLVREGAAPAAAKAAAPNAQAGGDPAPAWPLAGTGGQNAPAPTATNVNPAGPNATSPAAADAAAAPAVDSSSGRQSQRNQLPSVQPPAGPNLAATDATHGLPGARSWQQGAANPGTPSPTAVNQPPVGGQYQSAGPVNGATSVYGTGQLNSPGNGSQGSSPVGLLPNYQGAAAQQPSPPANTWINQDEATQPVPRRPDGPGLSPYDPALQTRLAPPASGGWTGVPAADYPPGSPTTDGYGAYPSQPQYGGQASAPPQGYAPQGYAPQNYPPQGYPAQGYPAQGYPPQNYPAQSYPPQGSLAQQNTNQPAGGWGGQPLYSASLGGQNNGQAPAQQPIEQAKQGEDSLMLPWEDPSERTFLVAYMDQKAKQESKIPDFWASLAEISNDRSLYYLAGSGSGYNGDEPWWPLTMAMLALFASLGGNFYIGWIAVGIYRRYLDVVIGGDEDRYERYRDDDNDRPESPVRDHGERSRDRDRSRDHDRSSRRALADDLD